MLKKSLLVFLSISLSVKTISAQSYAHYRGNIHAHTAYSDGNVDSTTTQVNSPEKSFNYAKTSAYMDFLGISEHNHPEGGLDITIPKYLAGVQHARITNVDGTFVSMYGMEFGTISTKGHSLIYGVDSLMGWTAGYNQIYCAKGDYISLFKLINARPKSWVSLAHPQTVDYDNLFTGAFNPDAEKAIVGCAMRSGSAFSTTLTYTDPVASSYESRFKTLLAKGYNASPTIDHDSHYSNFGRAQQGRTVVLSRSLNKDSIMDAFKNRRFYASDDWNATLQFSVNTLMMGSVDSITTNPSISISIADVDNEAVSKIELFYGIPGSGANSVVLTSNTGQTSLNYVHNINVNDTYYYHARVTQSDGDIIWSAPIRITKKTATIPVELITFNAFIRDKAGILIWTATQTNPVKYVIEKSDNGEKFTEIGIVKDGEKEDGIFQYTFDDTKLFKGVTYYRLRVEEIDGSFKFSKIVSVYNEASKLTLNNLYPNPATSNTSEVKLSFDSGINEQLMYVVYDVNGHEIFRNKEQVKVGMNEWKVNITDLESGFYFIIVSHPNERLLDVKFVKQ
jgi:Secretion system C-terminal sorting domain